MNYRKPEALLNRNLYLTSNDLFLFSLFQERVSNGSCGKVQKKQNILPPVRREILKKFLYAYPPLKRSLKGGARRQRELPSWLTGGWMRNFNSWNSLPPKSRALVRSTIARIEGVSVDGTNWNFASAFFDLRANLPLSFLRIFFCGVKENRKSRRALGVLRWQ